MHDLTVHEADKLAEADYFYSRMVAVRTGSPLIYNLSAFLSAARSVLLYARKEAKTKPRGQEWFDRCMAQSTVLKFFRNKRNLSIHEEPVRPVTRISASVSAVLRMSATLDVKVFDAEGNLREVRQADPPLLKHEAITGNAPRAALAPPSITAESTHFTDWAGPEDVLTLSLRYLNDLKKFVADGKARGFISL